MQVFQKSKSTILAIMTDLNIVPTLDFEKLVVCAEDTAFKPTKENMHALRVHSFTVSVLTCVLLKLRTIFFGSCF